MKYQDISNEITALSQFFIDRKSFVNDVAQRLMCALRDKDIGFPQNEVSLLNLDDGETAPERTTRDLKQQDADGETGFAIRYVKEIDPLHDIVLVVRWKLVFSDKGVVAQCGNDSKRVASNFVVPVNPKFIAELGENTIRLIIDGIKRMKYGDN